MAPSLLAHLKKHAFHSVKHVLHMPKKHIQAHAARAVHGAAVHMLQMGHPHHLVAKAHASAHKYVHGKGFWDNLKKGATSLYNVANPLLKQGLNFVANKGLDALANKYPQLAPLRGVGEAIANAGINALPSHLEGGFGGAIRRKRRVGGAVAKGSMAAKQRMAAVRAAKHGGRVRKSRAGSLYPAGY